MFFSTFFVRGGHFLTPSVFLEFSMGFGFFKPFGLNWPIVESLDIPTFSFMEGVIF